VLHEIPDGGLVIIDGLAFGAMPDQIERDSAPTGLSSGTMPSLRRIWTSAATVRLFVQLTE